MSNSGSKHVFERKLADKSIKFENGVTTYTYNYDIYCDGKLVNKRTVTRVKERKYPNKYNDIDHKERVLNLIKKYIEENSVTEETLSKRIFLDKILKQIVEYIDFHTKIKCTQAQIRLLINTEILKSNS